MQIKLLCLVTKGRNDNKIRDIFDNYKLPFCLSVDAFGTASKSLLSYFGLDEIKQRAYFAIIGDDSEYYILHDIKNKLKIKKPGNGISWIMPISSSNKFINDIVNKKRMDGVMVKNDIKRSLIVTIVQEGFTENVLAASKRKGANGGTIIHGRGLESKSAIKFLGFSIEPEKDIVLTVVNDDLKKDVMEEISNSVGIKTKGSGICFSMPVTSTIGIGEYYE